VVQLNESELALLAGGRDTDVVLAEILRFGPTLVVVTLGGRGVRYVAARALPGQASPWPRRCRDSEPVSGLVGPPFGHLDGDPTGCGDVCGAALFAGLLAGLSLEAALERAQLLAAVKVRHPDTSTLRSEFVRALGG
jgi:sugar/nucleoside kinase (ribokinase family)